MGRLSAATCLAVALVAVACERKPADQSPPAPGGPCGLLDPITACGVDGRTLLRCSEGRYATMTTCDGPAGCASSALGYEDASFPVIKCDVAAAVPGHVCLGILAACTSDRRSISLCIPGTVGKFDEPIPCRGPLGCHVDVCDQSIARLGDVCWMGNDDACTEDGREMLRCSGRTWSTVIACKGPSGCRPRGASDGKGTLARSFCDQSIAEAGEACVAEGTSACSGDGKALLTCNGGTFERTATCVGEPCKRSGSKLLCRKG